jgi:hypothetical protein
LFNEKQHFQIIIDTERQVWTKPLRGRVVCRHPS